MKFPHQYGPACAGARYCIWCSGSMHLNAQIGSNHCEMRTRSFRVIDGGKHEDGEDTVIRTEILCDRQEDPRARDPKARCHTLDNQTPGGEAIDFETAASKARTAATLAGWIRQALNRNRSRKGWVCPTCQARGDA